MALRNISDAYIITMLCMMVTWHTSAQVTITTEPIDTHRNRIILTFSLEKKDFLYKDFIYFSVDTPHITLSPWSSSREPIAYYDPLFKNTKYIFTDTVHISVIATTQEQYVPPAALHCSYYQKSEKKIITITYPLSYAAPLSPKHSLADDIYTRTFPHAQRPAASRIETYVTSLYTTLINYYTHCTVTSGIHGVLIMLLICLCIMPPYFFNKKIHTSTNVHELLSLITTTACCAMLCFCASYLHHYFTPCIRMMTVTIMTCCIGFVYTKKGTAFTWNYLRTFCTFFGGLLIALTIFFVFKTVQLARPFD